MLSFPNCKINLGLSVLNKRADGFHNLETIFYPVAFTDVLEIIACNETQPAFAAQAVTLSMTGLPVPGEPGDNLCIKAWKLLRADFPKLPFVDLHLHKVIPMGAGLGGGSADAAFTLRMLNERFSLLLTNQQLIDYAARLGSDCAFFIINTPCFASSRGEMLEPVTLDLTNYSMVFVNGRMHIDTGWAFAQLGMATREISRSGVSLKEVVQQPVASWKNILFNDFEIPVFYAYPEIARIKQQLYDAGALYASMTGSGSTVFGLFPKEATPGHNFTGADVFIVPAPGK